MSQWWISYLVIFLVGLIVTIATTPLAKAIARRVGAIDYPNARRINTKPIPRTGGIAIFCGLIAALIVQYVGTLIFDWPSAFISHPSLNLNYWVIAIATLIIFAVGLIDDIRTLKPYQKFIGQIIGACVAAAGGLLIGDIANPFGEGVLNLGIWAYPITVIYLVAFTNIINLIDGMDGLAAGVTGIAALSLFILTVLSGSADASALAIALVGCCIGFLRYNFHPASIFMGDSGSNVMGFLLGVIALLGVTRIAALTTLIVPLIITGVPIIDTIAAIIRRRRGHTGIMNADKGHIQHRLISRGLGQRQAVLLIYAWSILLAVGAFIITQVAVIPRIIIFIVLLVISIIFVTRLHLFEPVLRHYYNPVTKTDTVLPANDPVFTDGTGAENAGEIEGAENGGTEPATDGSEASAPDKDEV